MDVSKNHRSFRRAQRERNGRVKTQRCHCLFPARPEPVEGFFKPKNASTSSARTEQKSDKPLRRRGNVVLQLGGLSLLRQFSRLRICIVRILVITSRDRFILNPPVVRSGCWYRSKRRNPFHPWRKRSRTLTRVSTEFFMTTFPMSRHQQYATSWAAAPARPAARHSARQALPAA